MPIRACGKSALQRARAAVASRNGTKPEESLTAEQSALLEQYLDAFHRYDVDFLVALLREDATLSMPPYTLWLRGSNAIRAWLLARGAGCRGSRLLPTAACGLPAFGQYRLHPDGIHRPWSLTVLELLDARIAAWNAFLYTERLFPLFGLPPVRRDIGPIPRNAPGEILRVHAGRILLDPAKRGPAGPGEGALDDHE